MDQHFSSDGVMNEIWRPVVGWEGLYEVSSLGQVRSLDRWVDCGRYPTGQRIVLGKTLKQEVIWSGYHRVNLANGKPTHKAVHVLVAEAFIGPRPTDMLVCHNDGDKTNNRPSNLRYDTASANVRDCVKHGTQVHARKTHCPSGHAYDEANTSYRRTAAGGVGRHCLECHKLRERIRRAAAKAA